MARSFYPCLFLLPRYNRSYVTKNKIDQGQWVPLLLPRNWHQQPSSQEFKILVMVVVVLVAIVIQENIGKIYINK